MNEISRPDPLQSLLSGALQRSDSARSGDTKARGAGGSGESSLRLSETARNLAVIPEVRSEKVAEIKARIEAGEYHPDLRAIAERILGG